MRQLGLDLLCTNRDLPLSMPTLASSTTDFTLVVSAPVASVRCVVGPTAPRPCRGDGAYAWRFISHLGTELPKPGRIRTRCMARPRLRELLGLYVPGADGSVAARQLEGLLSVHAHPDCAPYPRLRGR